MEEFNNEIHLLSDVLKNNSIDLTANNIINKYNLNKYLYNNEKDVFEVVGELDISDEDLWKDNIDYEQKVLVTEEILFSIYKKLYSLVNKKNKYKQY